MQCSSGRAGLCAKGGWAMGLIPLVPAPSGKGGGGENGDAQYTTPWSIHGSSSKGRQRQQQTQTVELLGNTTKMMGNKGV